MRTKFPFTLEIDDESFILEYREMKKAQAKEFFKEFSSLQKKISDIETLKDEIALLETKKEVKNELAKASADKVALLEEVLLLLEEISKKKKMLKKLESETFDAEENAQKSFNLTVFGEGLALLKKTVEEKGISYYQLLEAINKAVKKEKEKKYKG